MSDPSSHRTLFAIDARDRRARRQLLGGRTRADPNRHRRSSDVTRMRPIAVAAALAALAVVAAWLLLPSGEGGRSGQLALPHQQAGLSCESCHIEGKQPAQSCLGCHGEHPSTRAGHRKLTAAGDMRCVTCHDVHGDDQGVRWLPGDDGGSSTTLRYWVGRHSSIEPSTLQVAQTTTVVMVPLARCRSCHALANPRDPLWRCVSNGGVSNGGVNNGGVNNGADVNAVGAINGCFDEHRRATEVADLPGKVCAGQHGGERFAAWDAARLTLGQPASIVAAPSYPWHWAWLAIGLLSAAVGGVGMRLWRGVKARAAGGKAAGAAKVADRVRLPQIDVSTCLGCYACVDSCPYDVLEIERYVARVKRPEACCGLTLCEQVCPNGSLVITDGDPIGDRPALDEQLQARATPGVYLAGDITGLPLIKNAIAQGHQAIDAIAAGMAKHPHPLDVIIVGAGPAGISAALQAQALKLRYRVLEQGSVAQSIRSFPRGKLVFAQPLDLPLVGKLWLEEASKEELLTKWLRIVRREKLIIDEHTRFVSSAAMADGFTVTARSLEDDSEQTLDAANLLLCVGQRGTPRKLALTIAPQLESKVFYHLADAHSFTDQRIVVVGLGDVAMETAIALARQPGTEVALVVRGDGFSRGKSRNVAEVKRLIDVGRISMHWNASVTEVSETEICLQVDGQTLRLANDAVFVMIGSLPPSALLEQVGVTTNSFPAPWGAPKLTHLT